MGDGDDTYDFGNMSGLLELLKGVDADLVMGADSNVRWMSIKELIDRGESQRPFSHSQILMVGLS